MKTKSKILIIAGSDSSGGAGIQADLKTVTALGSYGMTAITAITSQNTNGVKSIVPISPKEIINQIIFTSKDIKPDAVKIGMLHSSKVIQSVIKSLNEIKVKKIILDPVMVAKGGAKLINNKAIDLLRKKFIKRVTLITPNIPEAEILTKTTIRNKEDMIFAAHKLINLGAKNVLIKGGHLKSKIVEDIFLNKLDFKIFTSSRYNTKNTHGTGCTLSSAITTFLSCGKPIKKACELGIKYVNSAILTNPNYGKGHGPINHLNSMEIKKKIQIMRNIVVVGSQWGDEGKGKIVDWLSEQADVVIRFQGGHNAGHTLVIDGITYKLRLLPSGIVRKNKISVIGNGVVVDPWALLEEIEEIKSKGINVDINNFIISESANLILPFHREMDEIREDTAGKGKIGTTRRGIGPAYEDKVGRRSIRVMDLRSEKNLDQRLESVLQHHNAIRKGLGKKIFEKDQLKKDLLKIAPEILKFSQPVWLKIDQFKRQKKKILFEGAQGILLDVDHGTYPFVTSSNTVAASAATGTGCGPNSINYVLGITKAYTTRVGEGPFPTELNDNIGELLGTRGKEFGTVTSRKRRCGWFDGVLVRQTIKISGIDGIALTKLDVLDELDEIKMCVKYDLDGKQIDYLPASVEDQLKIKPIYKSFPGWKASTNGIKNIDDLPDNAKNYIYALEDFIGTKISSVSTSPERDDTILVENPFEV